MQTQTNKPLILSYRQTKELIKFLSREIFDFSQDEEMQSILQVLKNSAENHESLYGKKEEALGCGLFDKDNQDLMRSCGDVLFNNKIWLCKDCRYKDYTLEQLKIIDNSLQIVEGGI